MHREDIATDYEVVDLRLQAARSMLRRHPHAPELFDQLRRYNRSCPTAGLDLLGGLGSGICGILAGECGVGRDLIGRGGQVVYPDVGGVRNCTRKARLVGRVGWDWGTGDSPPRTSVRGIFELFLTW